jgi:hypothetical protein
MRGPMTIRLLFPLMLLALSGCILVNPHPAPRTKQSALRSTPQCSPNQYWDGTQCRHKGQGKGARKHDG